MEYTLSRHARNNLRLYGKRYDLVVEDILNTISYPDQNYVEGTDIIALRQFSGRFDAYPLKVVYTIENNRYIIISVYPKED